MTPELTLSRTLDPEHRLRHLQAGVDQNVLYDE